LKVKESKLEETKSKVDSLEKDLTESKAKLKEKEEECGQMKEINQTSYEEIKSLSCSLKNE